jgi:DNA (cytosine-5)-methyltransferase 1
MSDYVQQINLFASINPYYRLKGKIKVIELFAGIGSQIKALKILEKAQGENKTFEIESHKICEWAYNSYVMYNLIHTKDFTDYSQGKTKEEMLQRIFGTSTDYNTPLTMEQLSRKPIEWIKSAYNSCIATNNLVDISRVKGKDLDFDDNKNQTIIMSYSFPCQDISLSGHQKGLGKGSGTRSGLLWEVERILDERERESLPLPNILVMENVANLLSKSFINDFKEWEKKLASLGYTNHCQVLDTAKHGGIPQHRERVFMISILGDYAYEFPAKMPLKHELADLLETKVDEKYYLDEETINRISQWKSQQQPLDTAIDIERERERVMPTITTRVAESQDGGMSASMKLIKETIPNENENVEREKKVANKKCN